MNSESVRMNAIHHFQQSQKSLSASSGSYSHPKTKISFFTSKMGFFFLVPFLWKSVIWELQKPLGCPYEVRIGQNLGQSSFTATSEKHVGVSGTISPLKNRNFVFFIEKWIFWSTIFMKNGFFFYVSKSQKKTKDKKKKKNS